ncbi:MAG: DUF58 domain-containing protein [Roseiflexaceae bacterium]
MDGVRTDITAVLTDTQLQWLRQLQLPWRATATQGLIGERRSMTGRGNEPELLRRYQYGDDVRRIDWPATLRLQRPTVRQPLAVMPGRLQVILDTSPSMHVMPTKWQMARQLYASIGVVTTAHADMVASTHGAVVSPWIIDTSTWIDWASAVQPSADPFVLPTGLLQNQMTVFISDLWHTDALEIIRNLARQTPHLIVIHLLAQTEVEPTPGDEITLRDSESDAELTVTLTPQLIARYQEKLTTWRATLRQHCHSLAVDYVACHDQQSLPSIMTEVLQ